MSDKTAVENEVIIEEASFSKERGWNIKAKHPLFVTLIESVAACFKDSGGENYVEFSAYHQDLGGLTITIQRQDGKTPAMLAAKYKRQLETSRAYIVQLEGELDESRAYADKLVEQLADGCLPKDVELLRESNAEMAQQLHHACVILKMIADKGNSHQISYFDGAWCARKARKTLEALDGAENKQGEA